MPPPGGMFYLSPRRARVLISAGVGQAAPQTAGQIAQGPASRRPRRQSREDSAAKTVRRQFLKFLIDSRKGGKMIRSWLPLLTVKILTVKILTVKTMP
jgi:hypothetical protein